MTPGRAPWSTSAGWVFVAFVIDAYARRIVGWRTATTMTTSLVLDAIEQAIWVRQRDGRDQFDDLVAQNDRDVQYPSVAYSERLAQAGITASVGAVGSSYDNSLAESINGLYKTEVIRRQGPWRNVEAVEIATAKWIDWYNHRCLNPILRRHALTEARAQPRASDGSSHGGQGFVHVG